MSIKNKRDREQEIGVSSAPYSLLYVSSVQPFS
jgi:hypothetical protein